MGVDHWLTRSLTFRLFFWASGRLSVDVSLRLATSTSTTASFNDLFKNLSAKALTFLQFLYMFSFVKSSYQTSLWNIGLFGFCALSLVVICSAFRHSVMNSEASLFLSSGRRGFGPHLQSIRYSNDTRFESWMRCYSWWAIVARVQIFFRESRISCIFLTYFSLFTLTLRHLIFVLCSFLTRRRSNI